MDPLDVILPGIGAAANIVGGAIARGQQKRDIAQAREWFLEDREYNSPRNQLARIHEAGLPSAAYFGGSASSQSNVFSTPSGETDNGLGKAGDVIAGSQSVRMQRIAADTAQTNLEILKNQKKLSDIEVQDQLEIVPDAVFDDKTGTDTITMMPRVIQQKRQAQRMEDIKESAIVIQRDLQEIAREIAAATKPHEINAAKAKLDNIVWDNLGKAADVYTKQTENKYLESDLQFKRALQEIRRTLFNSLRNGKMPKIGDIVSMIALALENKL